MPRFLLSHSRLVPCLVGWLVRSATAAAALTNRQSITRTSSSRLCRVASLYTQPQQGNNHHHDNQDDRTVGLSPLAQHVQSVIQKEILPAVSSSSENSNMLSASDCHFHWIVGVSGGCDSVALLSVLLELQKDVCCHNNLMVVHFDHEQRGMESDGDCRLVQDWCKRAQVPCQTFYWSRDHDRAAAFSQETARDWRRAGMRRVGQEALAASNKTSNSIGLLVTAHHKDDSEETLLLKVLRGTHLMHLKGLEMVVSDTAANLFWVRPLLHVRKAALEAHLHDHSLAWRQDASNATPKYLRNRVRNELVPLLQDLVGGEVALERRIATLVQQSREIQKDVEPRVSSRLPHHVADQGRVFLLSPASPPLPSGGGGDGDDDPLATTTSGLLDWLGQQALYQWIVTQAPLVMGSHGDDKNDDDHDDTHRMTLSQDVWTRVVRQLENYPDRREWRINLGGGLDLVRTGMALHLQKGPSGSGGESKGTLLCEQEQESKVSWRVKDDDEPLLEEEDKDGLVLLLPRVWVDHWSDASTQDTGMILSTASKHAHLTVTPPWRKGRTPIRVLEFLRGQKVPLHQRGTAVLLLLPNMEGDGVVLAVHVPTKDKWVTDAAFAVGASREVGSDHVLVSVSKAKLCDRL